MHEGVRLAYLQAMGVTVWQPRVVLANASAPHEMPLPVIHSVQPSPEAFVDPPVDSEAIAHPPLDLPISAAQPQSAVPAELAATSVQPEPQPEPQPQPEPEPAALAPFYLQLWLAGPCALLIEINEPGLEKATAPYHLLCDILRAAKLPDKPVLFADFQWPLTRNPQFDRSAAAASQALTAFVQARLEEQSVLSLGCLGARCGLLAETDETVIATLVGREVALDELPPVWLGASLESLLREPFEKARLWKLLKRVMPRWVDQE